MTSTFFLFKHNFQRTKKKFNTVFWPVWYIELRVKVRIQERGEKRFYKIEVIHLAATQTLLNPILGFTKEQFTKQQLYFQRALSTVFYSPSPFEGRSVSKRTGGV